MEEPRPRPASGDRLERAQRLLVDLDDRHPRRPGLGVGSAILGLLLARLPIAQAFEWSLYDLRMRRTIDPAGAPKRIAIVEIDEQTLRAFEPVAGAGRGRGSSTAG